MVTVTYRGITAEHYREGKKFMIWYHKKGSHSYKDTVGIVQVRGISDFLTEAELRTHIDKLWERYYKNVKPEELA